MSRIVGTSLALVLLLAAPAWAQLAPPSLPHAPPSGPVDLSGKAVAVEIVLVEAKWVEGAGERPKLDSMEKLKEWLATTEKQGHNARVTKARFTTLDGTSSSVVVSDRVALASGRTRVGGGFGGGRGAEGAPAQPAFQTSYNYQEVGTRIEATPYVGADGTVAVKFQIAQSSPGPEAKRAADEAGDFTPRGVSTYSFQSTVRVANGQTQVVGGSSSEGANHSDNVIVLVSARVLEAGK